MTTIPHLVASPVFEPATRPAASRDDLTDVGRLLIACRDQPGIVSAVTQLLTGAGANIVTLDQYSDDPEGGNFFQRTEFYLPGLAPRLAALRLELDELITGRFGGSWELRQAARPKRVAIMVSTTSHNVLDLLWRRQQGQLNIDVPLVISNHPTLASAVRPFNIPFAHVPVDRADRAAAEERHLELLDGRVDLVVLARYMQIISAGFLERVGVPVINIHHSFLPAFIGAGPYQKAKDRGVKLVGATAHYVTQDLDEGPIIDQDVVRVSHRDTTRDLMRKGADVERQVLSRAVSWHVDDRVLLNGNSTVVF